MTRSTLIAALAAPLLLGAAWQQGLAAPLHTARPAAMPVQIYAGLQNGYLYSSADDGASWQEADTGLPSGVDVTALAAAPGSPLVAYAGTDGSGVYATNDGGRSWHQETGGNPALAGAHASGLAVDPWNPRVVYAAGGEGTIFKSGDGGGDWSAQALPVGSQVNALALDPLRPATLFVGTAADGILISTDGGASWQAPVAGTPTNVSVNAIAFSTSAADVAYAATDAGIYETIDGGATWQAEARGLPAAVPVQTITVDPAAGAHVLAGGSGGLLYVSTDGATSWQSETFRSCCNQISALLYMPAGPRVVVAGTTGGTLDVSTDGGHTWTLALAAPTPGSVLCLAATAYTPLPTAPVLAPHGLRGVQYFPQSQHSVRGAFLQFYTHYGGLQIFGLPLTEAFVEGGQFVQYFERARLVLVSGRVRISPLGRWLTAGREFPSATPSQAAAPALYFPTTHHALAGIFLSFWRAHHGALLFGPPISEPLYEQNGDGTGRTYLVQYFQNARMEYHPELARSRYVVTLGLLGQQYLRLRGWLA